MDDLRRPAQDWLGRLQDAGRGGRGEGAAGAEEGPLGGDGDDGEDEWDRMSTDSELLSESEAEEGFVVVRRG